MAVEPELGLIIDAGKKLMFNGRVTSVEASGRGFRGPLLLSL